MHAKIGQLALENDFLARRSAHPFVELRLRFIGKIHRQDLVARFGIQAAATRDLGQYKELGPRNPDYDTKAKAYSCELGSPAQGRSRGLVQEHETTDQDIPWNRIAEIELVPHPANVQHPDAIEAGYGMENGVLRMRVRAAMAGVI